MYHLPSKARFSEESLKEEHSLITYHNEKQILYQFYGINLNNNRKESENVKIALLICIGVSLIVICSLKMTINALSLYIRDMGMTPDKETISKYSEKAAKNFFHIPS